MALLPFPEPLADSTGHFLRVNNVQDIEGNAITDDSTIGLELILLLSGVISSDRTLVASAPGPNYSIVGDLLISPGVTLTIEPGVNLNFKANGDTANLGDFPTDAEIICERNLIALGTATDSISFGSDATFPQAGDWGQIKFSNSSQGILEFVNMRDGMIGLSTSSSGNVSITNSTIINQSLHGIYLLGGNLTVDDCVISQVDSIGIYADGGFLIATDNVIEQVGREGIRRIGGSGQIDRNSIMNIGGYGISGPNYGGLVIDGSSTTVRFNSIQFIGGHGITLEGPDVPRDPILGNTISNVELQGIRMVTDGAPDTLLNCHISDCPFDEGVYLVNPVDVHIENCLMIRCPRGIYVGSSDSSSSINVSVNYTTIVNGFSDGIRLVVNDSSSMLSARVHNSIISANTGYAIRKVGSGIVNADIRFIDQWNNSSGDYLGVACDSVCFSIDPMFANPSVDDYRLTDTSPLRAIGENGTQLGRYGPDPSNVVVGVPDQDHRPYPVLVNSPNPFIRSTSIQFTGDGHDQVVLEIFSVNGRRLFRSEPMEIMPGLNSIRFDREGLAAGIYFYRIAGKDLNRSSKMVIIN